MRLVCPNCEAKYEVPDDAIPDTGRDVQCANCNHSWFQMRPRPAGAAVPEESPAAVIPATEVAPDAPAPDLEASTEPVAEAEPLAEPEPEPVPEAAEPGEGEPETVIAAEEADEAPKAEPAEAVEPEADATAEADAAAADLADAPEPEPPMDEAAAEGGEAEEEEEEDPGAGKGPAGYAVDDSVLAILREEAEREANARRAEAAPLETQPDLGLDQAPPAPALSKDEIEDETEDDAKPASRRDPFPDVEEINSTLRPEEYPVEEPEEAEAEPPLPERRGGFRSGFLMVMTVAILASALYMAAPYLRSAIPALDETLAGYVAAVDGLRMQLDGMMRSATVAISGN